MPEHLSITFEQLKQYVCDLSPAPSAGVRDIGFADEERSIALSRDEHGRVELVLVGDQLTASRPAVERALDYNQHWRSTNEGTFPANQIVFPLDVFFDSAAALICVELIDAKYHEDPGTAFAQVEPLIEKFMTGGDQIGDQALMGLYGELTLLDALTSKARAGERDDLVRSWFGWRPSSRDFQIGETGVEVKTTSGSTSRHHIQGFHQIEVGHPVTDVAEVALHLLSIGVLPVPAGQRSGQSVPELVDSILRRISTPAAQEDFLDRVQEYGGDAGAGYKHSRDHDKSRFQKRFVLTFERLYDMTDEHIDVLRRTDVAGSLHIDTESVQFDVDLPYPFRGVVNPVVGMDSICGALLQARSRHL